MPSADRQVGTGGFALRAIGIRDPYSRPLSRPLVHTDRLDLKCRTAEQATLPLRFAVVGTVARWHLVARIRVLRSPDPLQRLMSLIARDARSARSWFDPRAACSMA